MSAIAEDVSRDRKLEKVRMLLNAIEQNKNDVEMELLEELTSVRESLLFQNIGQITREVHEALRMFEADTELAGIAVNDLPDAAERLSYVINATEQAANTTLNIIDDLSPKLSSIGGDSRDLSESWDRLIKNSGETTEYRATLKKIGGFINDVGEVTESVNAGLNEVLMAQEFQDLTSQVLFKVTTMVQTVEGHLVRLIQASGGAVVVPDKDNPSVEAEGPQIYDDNPNAVSGQDDVDDLLSSLGF